jgi:hypothetical protein
VAKRRQAGARNSDNVRTPGIATLEDVLGSLVGDVRERKLARARLGVS